MIRTLARLAQRHPRYGYKQIHARQVRQGWRVNLKCVRRLWNEFGLRRPRPRKKPRKLGPKPGSSANSCVQQPARFKNDVWAYDLLYHRTRTGGTLKWLSLADGYPWECLALRVDSSVTGVDLRRVLARVIGRRGALTRIRGDNGSEFICAVLTG